VASIGDLVVNLTADSTKMNAALSSAQKQLMTFGAAVAAAAGAAVTRFLQVGSSLDDMAQRTGVSVEALSGLSWAATMSDTSLEALQGSLVKMTKLIGEAQSGSKAASDALAGIGLSANQLQQLKPDEQFGAIADKIAAIQDPAAKTKAAMDIFGKSAAEILILLNQGSKGIRKFQDEAARTGKILDGETAESAAAAADAFDSLLKTIDALAVKVGAMFAPALTAVANTFAVFLGQNETLIRVLAAGAVGLAALAAALKITALATQAYAKAQAVLLALSSPKGLLMLGAAVAAAGFAVAALTTQFNGVNAEMEKAQKNATATAGAMAGIQGTAGSKPKTEFEARGERLAALQKEFDQISTFSAQGQAEALRNRLAQLTDDFKTLDLYGETELTEKQFEKYKQGVIENFTGVGQKIAELTNELAVLRGETTAQEQEFQRLANMGVGSQQLDQLRAMTAERDRLLTQQAAENKLIAEREAADERLKQSAADRVKGMQDEADAIKASLRTPEQVVAEQIKRIQELQKAGLLTAEESAAAIAKTQQEGQAGAQDTGVKFAGAMQRGSQEAYSAIIQAMGQRDNPQVKAIQAMDKSLGGKLDKIAGKKETKLEVVESIG